MFDFLRKNKAVPFQQLLDGVTPLIKARDEPALVRSFDEIIARLDEDPGKAEAVLGWAILNGCEMRLACIGKYVDWFVERFPKSISPVRVEMAIFLAETNKPESGTEFAREYLRIVRGAGHYARLPQMPIAQLGTSRAFLPLTAVYTHLGARSHSKRILAHGMALPVVPEYRQHFDREIANLDGELRDPHNASLDAKWEAFFQTGAHTAELIAHAESNQCPNFAKRLELIENNFRFRSDYKVDEEEFYQIVALFESGGKEALALV